MRYSFPPELLDSLQYALDTTNVLEERVEFSAPAKRDYILLKFETPVITPFDDSQKKNIIHWTIKGDEYLSSLCNTALSGMALIELGFRWSGSYHDRKTITYSGFAIKIIYECVDKIAQRAEVMHILCDTLLCEQLITDATHLNNKLRMALSPTPLLPLQHRTMQHRFLKPPVVNSATLEKIKYFLLTFIPAIKQKRFRPNEMGINPTYQDITSVHAPLEENHRKIWLFRADAIIAVGNKNAWWVSFGSNGLAETIDESGHPFLNWEDRYGHPSLAQPHDGYESEVICGGLLAQRDGYLEIHTSTGRYYRDDLNESMKKIVESYIAHYLQCAYGTQPVHFIDSPSAFDYYELSHGYNNIPFPMDCPTRVYSPENVYRVLSDTDFGALASEADVDPSVFSLKR